ncbi:MAG TPA: hypothetical protein VGL02_01330 [Streptomyces sp.]
MTRILHRPHPEQRPLLAACTTSAPKPAAVSRPRPGIAAEVLFDLRADDARNASFAAARALLAMPMHDPSADPQPIAALLDRAEHVKASRDAACRALFAEDRRRREDAVAAEWVSDAVATMLAENVAAVRAALAAHPELLHQHVVLMELAPVVAQLKVAGVMPR